MSHFHKSTCTHMKSPARPSSSYFNMSSYVCMRSAHQAAAYSSFLAKFFSSPLDGMLVHRRVTPQHEICRWPFYTWVERGTVRVVSCSRTQRSGPGQALNPNHYICSPEGKLLATTPLLFRRDVIKNETMTGNNDVIRSAFLDVLSKMMTSENQESRSKIIALINS